ncbi:hypothetical protein ACFFRR_007195 [Megaselia abdita]
MKNLSPNLFVFVCLFLKLSLTLALSEWEVTSLNGVKAYFDFIGTTRIIDGYIKIVTPVDLERIISLTASIIHGTDKYADVFNNSESIDILKESQRNLIEIFNELEALKDDPNHKYKVIAGNITQEDVNVVESKINHSPYAPRNISTDEIKLMNPQIEIHANSLLSIIKKLSVNSLDNEFLVSNFTNQSKLFKNEIIKFINAKRDGVTINPSELISILKDAFRKNDLLYTPVFENFDQLNGLLEHSIYFVGKSLRFVTKIPLVKKLVLKTFNIVKPLPFKSGSEWRIFKIAEDYLTISENNMEYSVVFDPRYNCKFLNQIFLCPNVPLNSTQNAKNCALSLYLKVNESPCKVARIKEKNVEVLHKLDNNRFIFVFTNPARYKSKCLDSQGGGTLTTVGLLKKPDNCSLQVGSFEIKNGHVMAVIVGNTKSEMCVNCTYILENSTITKNLRQLENLSDTDFHNREVNYEASSDDKSPETKSSSGWSIFIFILIVIMGLITPLMLEQKTTAICIIIVNIHLYILYMIF